MINILILGQGAREKVIYEILINESTKNNVYMLDTNFFDDIKNYCIENNIELVIPSTETYLCNGIVDYLTAKLLTIQIFGPNKFQAQLEGSKKFSKCLMQNLNIPTAEFKYFNYQYDCIKYLKTNIITSYVLKYSGLAKGKGVYLPKNMSESTENLSQLFKLGNEGIIIEECLFGTEVSVLAFCNGNEAILMPQAQDYKNIYDGNNGPNTGGMGAICPANILTDSELVLVKCHMDKIVKKLEYKGVLYAGLMKTINGVFFLEFNCRFGDPEAQVILNLLDNNEHNGKLINIIESCINGKNHDIKWKTNKSAAVVVLSHIDYPAKKLEEPVIITYKDMLDSSVKIYESNVIKKNYNNKNDTENDNNETENDNKYTTGGRVLSMVSIDKDIYSALENIYNNIYKITYSGVYYRRDIGCNNPISRYNNDNCNNKNNRLKEVNIGILASGNGTSIENLLEYRKNYVKMIITNRKDAGVIEKAHKYNIPFIYLPQKNITQTKYYENIVNIFRLYNIELVILAGFMKIVPDILFDEFFTINIHPSLLPKYNGLTDLYVHDVVISNKEQFSGCTLHQVIKDIDKGRFLLQKQYKLDSKETKYSLKANIQTLEKQCIVDYIDIYNYQQSKTQYSVDIEEGNEFVNDLKKVLPNIGGFCAEYNHKNIRLAAAADGCGTKIDLANEYNTLDTIGIDLVAMNVNDLIAGGAKPLFFMDYIALDKMDKTKCNTIIQGIREGCRQANCELIGGETAEMRGIYLKNKLDLAGFAIGEKVFDLPKPEMMSDKCILYGLQSSGVHSNGYTLVRKLLENKNKNNEVLEQLFIEKLLKPTIIYSSVLDNYVEHIYGIAHITGGGFHDNIIRILPDDLYFELEEWEFPEIFKWIQRESNLSRDEMLRTFNCGYGMVIISDKELDLPIIGRLIQK